MISLYSKLAYDELNEYNHGLSRSGVFILLLRGDSMLMIILMKRASQVGLSLRAYVLYVLEQRRDLGYNDKSLGSRALIGILTN